MIGAGIGWLTKSRCERAGPRDPGTPQLWKTVPDGQKRFSLGRSAYWQELVRSARSIAHNRPCRVAQLAEQRTVNPRVAGSSPAPAATFDLPRQRDCRGFCPACWHHPLSQPTFTRDGNPHPFLSAPARPLLLWRLSWSGTWVVISSGRLCASSVACGRIGTHRILGRPEHQVPSRRNQPAAMNKRFASAALALALLAGQAPSVVNAMPRPAPAQSPCQSAKTDYATARRAEALAEGVVRVKREKFGKARNLLTLLTNKVAGAQIQKDRATAALTTTSGYAADALAAKTAAQSAYDAAVNAGAPYLQITRARLLLRNAVNRSAYWDSQVVGKQATESTMIARLAAATAAVDAQTIVRDAAQAEVDVALAAYATAVEDSVDARSSRIAACYPS